jgi:hypothetical protein
MVFLTIALVVVAAAVTVDLLLTVGVIRRLRQHSELLATGAGINAPVPPKPGDPVHPFVATTPDGTMISRDSLSAAGLVVFLSPGCGPCEEQLPALVQALREAGRPRTSTLVVIVAEPTEAAHMITELETLAAVVCEPPPASQLQTAFGVWSAPLALRLDGAAIADVSMDTARLVAAARPPANAVS